MLPECRDQAMRRHEAAAMAYDEQNRKKKQL
jgi:hypothetical protein